MGGNRIKEVTTDKLRWDFTDQQLKPGECVEDFAMRTTTNTNQLRAIGDKITDKEVVKKILHSVPELLEQVEISIETLLDLNAMSIEVTTGHLRAVEERKKPISEAKERHLLLTEEEWMARLKTCESELSGGGRGGRGRGQGKHGGGRGGGGRGSPTNSNEENMR
jgi:hypothetical protein